MLACELFHRLLPVAFALGGDVHVVTPLDELVDHSVEKLQIPEVANGKDDAHQRRHHKATGMPAESRQVSRGVKPTRVSDIGVHGLRAWNVGNST